MAQDRTPELQIYNTYNDNHWDHGVKVIIEEDDRATNLVELIKEGFMMTVMV